MTSDIIKDRLLNDLEALRTELSSNTAGDDAEPEAAKKSAALSEAPPEEVSATDDAADTAIPTLSEGEVPTLAKAATKEISVHAHKEQLKQLDSELEDILPDDIDADDSETESEHVKPKTQGAKNQKAKKTTRKRKKPATNKSKTQTDKNKTENGVNDDSKIVASETNKTSETNNKNTQPTADISKPDDADSTEIKMSDSDTTAEKEAQESKKPTQVSSTEKEETPVEAGDDIPIIRDQVVPATHHKPDPSLNKEPNESDALPESNAPLLQSQPEAQITADEHKPIPETIEPPAQPLSSNNPAKAPMDENPFLPKHLRERLNKSKSNLMEDIARSTDALNASSAFLRNYSAPTEASEPKSGSSNVRSSHKELIDSLVAQYLPIIEAELRKRLEQSFTAPLSSTATEKKPKE